MTTYGDIASDKILKEGLAGFDATDQVETQYEGIGYLVSLICEGAVEDEVAVANVSLNDLVPALREALENDGDETVEIIISEVYIGTDTIEATGYETDTRIALND